MRGKIHSLAMLSAFVGLMAFMVQEVDARGGGAAAGRRRPRRRRLQRRRIEQHEPRRRLRRPRQL